MDAGGHLNQFKKKKGDKSDKSDTELPLYIENIYAIRIIPPGIYTYNQATNKPNLLLNLFVDMLNQKAKLPHTLVIVINDHKFWNQTDLLQFQMERLIRKFIKEIQKIAEQRNFSLPIKAVNWNYPRLFITKALPLPNNMESYPKGFKANRRKYNKLLL